MNKAYDRLKWVFLEAILLKLGFKPEWVNMIMACVSSVEYKVTYNSVESETIKPSRGLRQGDPLSPYLFLLCAEGLSSLLKYYNGGTIDRGLRVNYRSSWVTHLLFADDSLIFINASNPSALRLNDILRIYGEASGQCINREKSSIYFSTNTPIDLK